MRSPTFLTNPLVPLVADSSTVINLIATGRAPAILEYYSPYNTQELLDLMVKYMDAKTLQQKERQIAEQYKLVTWDHTYNQVNKFVANSK